MSVSLPIELPEFAQDMNLGVYGGWNEYLRDLLRQRRRERIQQEVCALEAAIKGPHMAISGLSQSYAKATNRLRTQPFAFRRWPARADPGHRWEGLHSNSTARGIELLWDS